MGMTWLHFLRRTSDRVMPCRPRPDRSLGAMADVAFVGLVLVGALALVGPAVNPMNLEWLWGDLASHYIGWGFFRQAEGWLFPLSHTPLIGYPVGSTLALMDGIPLVAIPLRLIEQWLPTPFQYLGAFQVSSVVLSGIFGLLIARRVGLDRWASYLAALFFASAPILLLRMTGHTSLTAHWLILWPLLIYLGMGSGPGLTRSQMTQLAAAIVLSAMVHPYLLAMVGMVLCAMALRSWLSGGRFLWAAYGLLAAAGLAAGSMFVGGAIWIADPTHGASGGYRFFSMNLLAPFNPGPRGGFLWGGLPTANPAQAFEGYGYLGLGVLALAGVTVLTVGLRRIRSQWTASVLLHQTLPLALMALGATALAASATVTLGSITLVTIPLPFLVEGGLSVFRASGRLFWPAYYVLIVGVLVVVARWPRPWALAGLAVAVVVQGLDLRPLYQTVANGHRSTTQTLEWVRDLGPELAQADHLVVLPTTFCDGDRTPGGRWAYRDFGLLALSSGTTLNSYGAGRYGFVSRNWHCREAVEAFVAGPLQPRTVYVVDTILAASIAPERRAAECRPVGSAYLCRLGLASPN